MASRKLTYPQMPPQPSGGQGRFPVRQTVVLQKLLEHESVPTRDVYGTNPNI